MHTKQTVSQWRTVTRCVCLRYVLGAAMLMALLVVLICTSFAPALALKTRLGGKKKRRSHLACDAGSHFPLSVRRHPPPHGNSSVTLVGGEQEGERRSDPLGPIRPQGPMSHGACSFTAIAVKLQAP